MQLQPIYYNTQILDIPLCAACNKYIAKNYRIYFFSRNFKKLCIKCDKSLPQKCADFVANIYKKLWQIPKKSYEFILDIFQQLFIVK